MTRYTHLPATLLALSNLAAATPVEQLPAPLLALERQGLHITGTFKSESGLKAYDGVVDGHPVALYLTSDGKFAMAGTMLDSSGNVLDREAIASAVSQPPGAADWKRLDASGWVADGKPTAPRVVYVFTDPNCPYCAKLWADARPWVDSGKVQLRHIIVGILTRTSPANAAALLSTRIPARHFGHTKLLTHLPSSRRWQPVAARTPWATRASSQLATCLQRWQRGLTRMPSSWLRLAFRQRRALSGRTRPASFARAQACLTPSLPKSSAPGEHHGPLTPEDCPARAYRQRTGASTQPPCQSDKRRKYGLLSTPRLWLRRWTTRMTWQTA